MTQHPNLVIVIIDIIFSHLIKYRSRSVSETKILFTQVSPFETRSLLKLFFNEVLEKCVIYEGNIINGEEISQVSQHAQLSTARAAGKSSDSQAEVERKPRLGEGHYFYSFFSTQTLLFCSQ